MYRLDLKNTLPDGQHIEDYARVAGVKLTGYRTLSEARAAAHLIEQWPDDDGNVAQCDVIEPEVQSLPWVVADRSARRIHRSASEVDARAFAETRADAHGEVVYYYPEGRHGWGPAPGQRMIEAHPDPEREARRAAEIARADYDVSG